MMGAGFGQRWAEIKTTLGPRLGLGNTSSKFKRGASASSGKRKKKIPEMTLLFLAAFSPVGPLPVSRC